MMSGIAQLSEKMRAVYGRYSTYIDMIWKFVAAFACFFWIRSVIGFSTLCSNPFVLLVLALLCVIFPIGAIPVFSCILIVGQAFGLGLDAGAISLVVILILYIFFVRFVPDDSIAMILLPMTMFFGFGPLVPMVLGLKRRASSIFAVVYGVVIYYLMANLGRESQRLKTTPLSDYNARLKLLINGVFSPTMVVMTLALAAGFLIVYAIRKLEFDYSHLVAVAVGAIVYILFIFMGNAVIGTDISPITAVVNAVASAIAALLAELLMRPLDYTRSEKLEFEDDDYYYYVKAIPKAAANRREMERMKQEEEPEDLERPDLGDVNFEERLEDSLRNL